MIRKPSDKPAFPAVAIVGEEPSQLQVHYTGLTKREYFAGIIMAGSIAKELPLRLAKMSGEDLAATFAQGAVILADALLAELAKEGGAS